MGAITNDWLDAIGAEFHKEYYRDLYNFVKDEYNHHLVFPNAEDIFNAFQ